MSGVPLARRTHRGRLGHVSFSTILAYAVLALGSVVMLFPFVWMITSAFKVPSQINAIPPVWIPRPVVLSNFEVVWRRVDLTRLYANSLFVSSSLTAIVLYTSASVGYVFAKYQFRGRDLIFLAIIATMMIPWPATMVPVYQVCLKLGLINSWWGIIIPSVFSTFGIFMMRQFMHSIPNELCDAARVDGCRDWGTFHRIVLPNCGPALGALGIFTFMWNWNSFLWPLIVLMDEKLYTLPIGIAYFAGQWWSDIGPTLAGASGAVIPVLVVFLLFQSHIVEGVTMTGLK